MAPVNAQAEGKWEGSQRRSRLGQGAAGMRGPPASGPHLPADFSGPPPDQAPCPVLLRPLTVCVPDCSYAGLCFRDQIITALSC
jgi:hypothetical protein